jgi:anaerobic ribonucleoside-triphosphate reductase activating protein
LGGEPFELANQLGLLPLVRKVKEIYPDKKIWSYSGYLFDEQILAKMASEHLYTREFLSYIDVLVDGKFVQALYNPSLKFRGSSNQRVIDVQKSLQENKVILYLE